MRSPGFFARIHCFLFGLTVLWFLFALQASAATDAECKQLGPNFRAARPDDSIVSVEKMLTPGQCYDPTNAYVGTQASDAKAWLAQHSKGVDISRINCLDTQFAEKLKAFMESNPYGPPTITGAYRSTAEQDAIIRGGRGTMTTYACQSYHPWGLAVDFNNSSDNQRVTWMRQHVGGNTGIAVIGDWDYGHFQSAASRTGSCGTCAVSGAMASGDGHPQNGMAQSPVQNAMNALRNMFSPPQPMQCGAGFVLLNGSCVPQQAMQPAQNPFDYFPPQATTTPAASSTNINFNTDMNTSKSTSTSAIDLINAIANPNSNTATSTTIGKSVALNDSLKNTVTLDSAGRNPNTISTSSTLALAPAVPQTFISDDMSKSSLPPITSGNNSTFALLERLRLVLVSIIQMLRPFGGTVPNTAATKTTTVILE